MSDAAAVFVYGTLMPGQAAWDVLRPFALVAEPASALGQLFDTGSGYPAAQFSATGTIHGSRVTLVERRANEAFARLDAYEGAGTLYRRLTIMTSAGAAQSYEWLGSTAGLRRLGPTWPATA